MATGGNAAQVVIFVNQRGFDHAKVIYKAAAELKLRIPEDVSVVGFSDDDFSGEMFPPLTTVHQPAYEIGQRAGEVVLGRSMGEIRGREAVVEELPVILIERQSCLAMKHTT